MDKYGIIDLYVSIKFPERFAKIQDENSLIIHKFNLPSEQVLKKAIVRYRAELIRNLHPDLVAGLTEVGDTPEEYVASKLRRNKEKLAGAKINKHLEPQLKTAVEAFVKAEAEGLTTTDAIKYAVDAVSKCPSPADEKTIKGWLNTIMESEALSGELRCTLIKAKRGRPAKNRK